MRVALLFGVPMVAGDGGGFLADLSVAESVARPGVFLFILQPLLGPFGSDRSVLSLGFPDSSLARESLCLAALARSQDSGTRL